MDTYHLSPTADGWELKKAGANVLRSVPPPSKNWLAHCPTSFTAKQHR